MYFTSEFEVVLKSDLLINERVNRVCLLNSIDVFPVVVGDIIAISFWKAAIVYKFEGICIAIKKKSLLNINTSLIIRNVISGVGIEVVVSFFMNRVFSLSILDYQRKQFLYRKSKLYYLRGKLNRASRVK